MNKFYDMIACDYDRQIAEDIEEGRFPYAAYGEMQDMIASYIFENKHLSEAKILDIGIGTASMYEKIMPQKYSLYGLDISEKMLEVAKLRLPQAQLYHQDILEGLPEGLENANFDYIIINFVCMHFPLPTLINLIARLTRNLSPFGKIFISDIMFADAGKRKAFLSAHQECLSKKYHYHSFEQIVAKSDDALALSFMEFNEYSGILIIEKYYESSLHYEDSLVKYKTNTMKWKSNQSKSSRE